MMRRMKRMRDERARWERVAYKQIQRLHHTVTAQETWSSFTMSRRARPDTGHDSSTAIPATKRRRAEDDTPVKLVSDERPKSRKELRAEKKAAKKAQAFRQLSEKEQKAQLTRLKKEMRKEERKEQEHLKIQELRKEKRIRKQKKINRQLNAPGGQTKTPKIATKEGKNKGKKEASSDEQDVSMTVFNQVFRASKGPDQEGFTSLRLGVRAKDIVVGTGSVVQDRVLVTVKYELTGGRFGAVLDSSKNFKFRLGKGEVIQGWDIGMEGMREGGRRKLIIPPKAGYGSQDIGAGSGATLYFDITLLSCRIR